MRRTGLLMLAAAVLLPLDAVEAQLLFGSRLGEAHYQGDDTKIIMQVGADMLRNAPDGESRPWSNPQTGHGGTITMVRSYERNGMPCRDARMSSDVGRRNVVYILPVCRIADGTWKFAPQ
ncbi:RT0821/Lpp0805 family surface protein [Skermanella pratensis]|uniref:RT0821/Lpp0805 family surface protein n=1 Tax=Skermanella pratensis TaxID=2233999 RepID=UPI001B3BD15E|nr:RT0821/Lpp0805 family surface protein [Skermanella pratensis]